MKYFVYTALFSVLGTSAMAAAPTRVPEMDAGAGVAAIALLVGIAAVIRERTKRK